MPWERPAAIRRGLVRDARTHGATQQQAPRVTDGAPTSGSLAESTAESPTQDETQRRLLKAKGPLYRRLSGQALKTSFLLSTQQVASPVLPYAATGSPSFYTAEILAARFVGAAVVLCVAKLRTPCCPTCRRHPGSPSPTLRGWLRQSTPSGLSAVCRSPPRWCVCCGSTSTGGRPLLPPPPPPPSPPPRRACTGLRGAAREQTSDCCLSSPRPRSCSRRCSHRCPRLRRASRAALCRCPRRCRAARGCLLLLTPPGPQKRRRRVVRGPQARLLHLQTPRGP